jgi:S1-C subfamily serine protease
MSINPVTPFTMMLALSMAVLLPGCGAAVESSVAGSGTAFVVGTDGEAITSNRFAGQCDRIQTKRQGRVVKATIIARDSDLALLQFDSPIPKNAVIRAAPDIRIGDEVVTFGYPLGSLLADGSLSLGIVNALAGFLQISVPIQPGNSGGPLIDRVEMSLELSREP